MKHLIIIAVAFSVTVCVYENPVAAESFETTEVDRGLSSQNADREDEQPLAIVRRYRPTVRLFPSHQNIMQEVERAQRLYDADTLATQDEGYAMVQFTDNSVARMQPNSLLIVTGEVTEENTTAANLAIEIGELLLNTKDEEGDYTVETPTAVAAVKGTEFVTMVEEDGSSDFTIISGEVDIQPINSIETHTVESNLSARVDSEGISMERIEIGEDEVGEIRDTYERFDEMTSPANLRIILKGDDDQDMREINLRYFDLRDENK